MSAKLVCIYQKTNTCSLLQAAGAHDYISCTANFHLVHAGYAIYNFCISSSIHLYIKFSKENSTHTVYIKVLNGISMSICETHHSNKTILLLYCMLGIMKVWGFLPNNIT